MNDEEIKKKARNKAGISFRKPHTVFTDAINNFLMEKAIVLARADTAEHYMTEIDFYIKQNAELIRKIKISRREALEAVKDKLAFSERFIEELKFKSKLEGEQIGYVKVLEWLDGESNICNIVDRYKKKFKVGKGGLSV